MGNEELRALLNAEGFGGGKAVRATLRARGYIARRKRDTGVTIIYKASWLKGSGDGAMTYAQPTGAWAPAQPACTWAAAQAAGGEYLGYSTMSSEELRALLNAEGFGDAVAVRATLRARGYATRLTKSGATITYRLPCMSREEGGPARDGSRSRGGQGRRRRPKPRRQGRDARATIP